jgi:hypothetical protein
LEDPVSKTTFNPGNIRTIPTPSVELTNVEDVVDENVSQALDALESARPQGIAIDPRTIAQPGAVQNPLPQLINRDLQTSLDAMIERMNALPSPEVAAGEIDALEAQLAKMKIQDFDLEKLRQGSNGPDAMSKLLELGRAMVARASDFGSKYLGDSGEAMSIAMRKLDRRLAYIGDMVVLNVEGAKNYAGGKPGLARELGSDAIHFNMAPGYESLADLPDGFFITVDGGSPVSGVIKNMPAHDGNASHMAMILRHPNTGKFMCVEALVGEGVTVKEWEPAKWLSSDARADFYVPKTKLQPAFLAGAIYRYNEAVQAANKGENIPYDFRLGADADDFTHQFCSEIVEATMKNEMFSSAAVEWQLPELKYPEHKNELPMTPGVRRILNLWGAGDVKTVSSPNDIKVSTLFEHVGEVRTLPGSEKNIQRSHVQNAVYGAIFNRWMGELNYVLEDPPLALNAIKSFFGVLLKDTEYTVNDLLKKVDWPLEMNVVHHKMQREVSQGIIRSILTVEDTFGIVLKEMVKRTDDFRAQNGRDMSEAEMAAEVEKIRVGDLARYERWKSGEDQLYPSQDSIPDFHDMLHPAK